MFRLQDVYVLGVKQRVKKFAPNGCLQMVIHQPVRGGVLINDESYWPVKLKHRGSGHIKWVSLHSDEPTVQSTVKETMENKVKNKLLP